MFHLQVVQVWSCLVYVRACVRACVRVGVLCTIILGYMQVCLLGTQ